jgi:hypothetical protein
MPVSRKDEKSVIFKKKEETVMEVDPTDAPEGFTAVLAHDGCGGCAFEHTRKINGRGVCPRTAEGSTRCLIASRKDRMSVIFKKAETPAPPKPVDLRAFDNDTLMRTIGLLLTEATNRHILSSYHLNLPKPPVSEEK